MVGRAIRLIWILKFSKSFEGLISCVRKVKGNPFYDNPVAINTGTKVSHFPESETLPRIVGAENDSDIGSIANQWIISRVTTYLESDLS
jgi:hypothetical protein